MDPVAAPRPRRDRTLRVVRSATLVACLLASSGCARTLIESRRAPDYDRKLRRTLIICALDPLAGTFIEHFQARFAEELGRRGVAVRYAIPDEALQLERTASVREQVAAFGATTVLSLRVVGGVVDRINHVQSARIDGEIHDLAQDRRVWRAEVRFAPLWGAREDARGMVDELVRALVADGLVAGLPPER